MDNGSECLTPYKHGESTQASGYLVRGHDREFQDLDGRLYGLAASASRVMPARLVDLCDQHGWGSRIKRSQDGRCHIIYVDTPLKDVT